MSGKFIFLAGNLCLDFVNTQIMSRGELTDLLGSEADFSLWIEESGIFEESVPEGIQSDWCREIYTQAREFRQQLRDMVEALEHDQAVPDASIAAINHYLQDDPAYWQIEVIDGHYHSHFHYHLSRAEQLLYPLARSAQELLSASDHSRIRQCASDKCVLHFYDSSKNGSRRWCSMETCGNRRKVKRHYHRKQN